MDKKSQIKNCITIWNNRLRRLESTMRQKRDAMEERQKAYEQSINAAQEAEARIPEKLAALNKEMTQRARSIQDINKILEQERRVGDEVSQMKFQITKFKSSLDAAEIEFEESKAEVSMALRKLEKYELISTTLG